jgi:tetratricopeptide (TPR) repeat protein
MPQSGSASGTAAAFASLANLIALSQLDFELDFYSGLLRRHGAFVDALRAHGNNLTLKGRLRDGLEIDQQLIALRPNDPVVHYNLACSYALLGKVDLALKTLRKAIELGYRDFRYMREDCDLQAVRDDPRFADLLTEFENLK